MTRGFSVLSHSLPRKGLSLGTQKFPKKFPDDKSLGIFGSFSVKNYSLERGKIYQPKLIVYVWAFC